MGSTFITLSHSPFKNHPLNKYWAFYPPQKADGILGLSPTKKLTEDLKQIYKGSCR
ncbi:MAG: hypothetical protein IJD28_01860 [Deferribacterales bacterium]|nr:hypothetical protein [Deferribacterales bacterium]